MTVDIGLQYIDGMLSEQELSEIELLCQKHKLAFETRDLSRVPFAAAGDLIQFFIFLSPSIIEAISMGALSNATYDALKSIIGKCATSISGKMFYNVSRSKQVQNVAKFYLRSSSSELIIEIPPDNKQAIELAIKKLTAAYEKSTKKN